MYKHITNLVLLITLAVCLSGCIGSPKVIVSVPSKIVSKGNSFINRAPQLDTISNQIVPTTIAIATINAGENGLDVDSDGNSLAYSCFYDLTINGNVASTNSCSSLAGVTFSIVTGVMDWTPTAGQFGLYEFKIIATDGSLSDEKIFSISVNDNNHAPVLDAIVNQSINENSAITTIDAADGGDDFDSDGDAITYSCYLDTAIDGAVASTTACSTISGITFTASTGVLNWMPDLTQSGTYEFKIVGSDGSLSDEKIFSITVNNVNQAPLLDSIADETVVEGIAITTVNAGDGGDDLDRDGQTITYTCYYDTTVDGSVASVTSCSSLTGVSFTAATGVLNWLPLSNQSGNYEFKIIGSDGSLTGSEIFAITVTDSNQAPVLAAISNQSVNENVAITTINANDGGDDLDADGDTITYTCYYDTVYDSAVASTTACSTLTGVTFTASTGVMNWTPNFSQAGNYEFKIIGSDGSLSGSSIFRITVANVNQAPILDAISNQTISANTAMTTVDVGDGGDDLDADGDTISYSCYYDTTINGSVAITNSCTSLSGVTFSGSTGVMNWTPTYLQAGSYEFRVVGQDASLSTGRIFTVTVTTNTPFAFVFRIASPGTTIVLPTRAGTTNFAVNYGDGSAAAAVTSVGDPDNTHTYAAAGDYTVTITGELSSIGFSNANARTSLYKVINLGNTGLTDLSSAFLNCTNLIEFAGGVTTNVTTMASMFSGATKLAVADLYNFNTINVTDMSNMFNNTPLLATLDISNFNTSNVTTMLNMFQKTSILPSLDLKHFNTAKVTTMQGMFADSGIVTLDVTNFNTSLVTDMSKMFYNAAKITSLNLAGFVTPNVTNMSQMFYQTTKLATLDIQNFNTTNVTNMSNMFNGAPELTSLDLSHFNTANVTNMSSMFNGTTKLSFLDISNFNTANVLTMDGMFTNARALTTLNLSHFVTTKVTTMSSMFQTMLSLTSINLSSFNTANVTNMTSMFNNCSSLTSLDVSTFNTAKVTSMNFMFQGVRVPTLNLSNFNTGAVTTMATMFQNTSFTTLNISSFNTAAVTDMTNMFFQTTMSSLNLSHFNTGNVTVMNGMFQGAGSLLSLNTTNWVLTAGASASTNFFNSTNPSLVVTCNQGGSPATGTFFGKACN